MQLRYDDDFLEGAVFVRANSRRGSVVPRLQLRRFHAERERLYSILDPDERNGAFFHLHLEWFREWGMEQLLLELAGEFPLFQAALNALVFRKARVKSDEGAELYVKSVGQTFLSAGSGDFPVARRNTGLESPVNRQAGKPAPHFRSAVIALRVERFEQPEELTRFLRHELTHVHDMVDPEFGYSPQWRLPGQNAAQERLTRERYRLLWDITIDGRLAVAADVRRRIENTRSANAPPPHVGGYEQHRMTFDRAFGFWPENRRDEVFDSLWSKRHPHHDQLMAMASDPRDLKSTQDPTPGAPCPLCGFSTFDWVDADRLNEETVRAIQREFPQWTPDQGTCGRCVQIYRIAAVAPCR